MIARNRYRILHIAGNSRADRLKCHVCLADPLASRYRLIGTAARKHHAP
jgi:hypothetical protein